MIWRRRWKGLVHLALVLPGLGATEARCEMLTADRAVEMALKHNLDVANAEAGVLQGRSGLYGAYAGVLPSLTASLSRFEQRTSDQTGFQQFGQEVFRSDFDRREVTAITPGLSVDWAIFDLSGWTQVSSARAGLRSARYSRQATRNDVVLATRRQFYEVVKAIKLAEVAGGALKLAQDDERRVRALFEVGSVSKSDLLKAQVRTAQSELDNLTRRQAVTNQRITLARQIGMDERALGEVDTVLTAERREFDEARMLALALEARPDIRAAEAELAAARAGLTSARLARLPAVVGRGTLELQSSSQFASVFPVQDSLGVIIGTSERRGETETDRDWQVSVALQWNLFDGLLTDSRVAGARARLIRAEQGLAAVKRNLEGEVRQALIVYREASESESVARRGLESARENLKLSQEKYNVGSATILELIDAQVQLQRAQSDLVSALAAIRVAEAQVERVRGSAG